MRFTDDIFKCILLNENLWIPNKISLKFVAKGPINNIPALVQIMAWHQPGDKPLSEPMMVSSLTHICVIWPQWVKSDGNMVICSCCYAIFPDKNQVSTEVMISSTIHNILVLSGSWTLKLIFIDCEANYPNFVRGFHDNLNAWHFKAAVSYRINC